MQDCEKALWAGGNISRDSSAVNWTGYILDCKLGNYEGTYLVELLFYVIISSRAGVYTTDRLCSDSPQVKSQHSHQFLQFWNDYQSASHLAHFCDINKQNSIQITTINYYYYLVSRTKHADRTTWWQMLADDRFLKEHVNYQRLNLVRFCIICRILLWFDDDF